MKATRTTSRGHPGRSLVPASSTLPVTPDDAQTGIVHSPPLLGEFCALRESENTRLAYRRDIVEFYFFTNCKDPRDVTVEDCVRYFDSFKRRSRATQNRKRSVLRNYFTFLREMDYFSHGSPMRLIPPLKRTYNPSTRRWLRRDEIQKLLTAVKDRRTTVGARDHAMVRLMIATGLRVSEVVGLRMGDHVFEGGRHWLNVEGKGGYVRRAMVPADTWNDVEHYLQRRGGSIKTPGDHLFQRTPGRGPHPANKADKRLTRASLHHRIRRLAESVGLQGVHPHALRHTFAVAARVAGTDIYVLSRAMGHSSTITTSMYQHLMEEEHESAFAAVDRYLRGKIKATRKPRRPGSDQ